MYKLIISGSIFVSKRIYFSMWRDGMKLAGCSLNLRLDFFKHLNIFDIDSQLFLCKSIAGRKLKLIKSYNEGNFGFFVS